MLGLVDMSYFLTLGATLKSSMFDESGPEGTVQLVQSNSKWKPVDRKQWHVVGVDGASVVERFQSYLEKLKPASSVPEANTKWKKKTHNIMI